MNLTPEQIMMITEVGEIIRHQTLANEMLGEFRKQFPFAIPPNIFDMVNANLRDNIQVLYREMNVLHKPNNEKRRWACSKCNRVFAMPLPGGLCDECRTAKITAGNQPDYSKLNAALRRAKVTAAAPKPKPADKPAPAPKQAKAKKKRKKQAAKKSADKAK